MNKIVCLLVASLLCVGVASGVAPTAAAVNDAVRIVQNTLAVHAIYVRHFSDDHGSRINIEDADALTSAGSVLETAVASILTRGIGNKKEIVAGFVEYVDPVKNKVIDYARRVGSTSPGTTAVVAAITEVFDGLKSQVNATLDAAIAAPHRVAPTAAAFNDRASGLTNNDANALTRAGTNLEKAVASIPGNGRATKSATAVGFEPYVNRVKNKIRAYARRVGSTAGYANPCTIVVVAAITEVFDGLNTQANAILDVAIAAPQRLSG